MMRQSRKILLASAFLVALAFVAAPTAAFASTVKPNHIACTPDWVYDNVTNAGTDYVSLMPGTFSQYNPYNYTITANWSIWVTGSVSVSASAGVSGDLSAIVAGVQVSVNYQVTFTVSVTAYEGVSVPIPPHQTIYGQYSAERQKAYGHLYYLTNYCTVSNDYGRVESWTPWTTTWHLW